MLQRTVCGVGLVSLAFLHQSEAFLSARAPLRQEEGKKGSTGQTETRAFASVERMKNDKVGVATSKANGVSAETLKEWAKRVVKHDMGLKDEDLLDESFYFIGPFDGPVGKRPFVDGSKTFDLRGAFPDFEFNEHDFRVDDVQPMRVWLTTRKTGTHQGDLPMYGKLIKPTGRKLDSPPETYSCTFNEQGKCIKLTGGFVMDAQQGTSGGLGGPLGIAKAVGHPRSIFSHEPPVKALRELAARAFRKGADRAPYMPPTEAVMPEDELKALAMSVLVDEDMGRHNVDRLAPDFTFYDPLIGTLDRKTYTSWYLPSFDLNASFPDDLEVLAYNVRVEEGDRAPCTVWVTMRTSGTHTGAPFGSGPLKGPAKTGLRYESPPEAVSLTFNKDRQLTRLTVGAVMDREEGNTCGLGGIHGVRYALGRPSSPLLTRPFRFQNKNEWAQSMRALASPVVDTVTQLASKLTKNRPSSASTSNVEGTDIAAEANQAAEPGSQAMQDAKVNNTNASDDAAGGKKQNDEKPAAKNGKPQEAVDVEMITAKVS